MIACDCQFPSICDDCRGCGYVLCSECGEQPATHENDGDEPVCTDCHPPPERCSICERKLSYAFDVYGEFVEPRNLHVPLCKTCEQTARAAGKQAADAMRYPDPEDRSGT